MTTYNAAAVDNTAIAYEKGITLQQGRALRDNPIAMAEGATDAPYIQAAWHPYDGVTVGDGNLGVIYDFSVDGAVATVTTPDFDNGYEYQLRFYDVSPGTTGVNPQIELYRQTSTAWTSAYVSSISVASSSDFYGWVDIISPRVSREYGLCDVALVSAASDRSVQRLSLSSAQRVLKARFSFSTGTIDGGKISLFRRLAYA